MRQFKLAAVLACSFSVVANAAITIPTIDRARIAQNKELVVRQLKANVRHRTIAKCAAVAALAGYLCYWKLSGPTPAEVLTQQEIDKLVEPLRLSFDDMLPGLTDGRKSPEVIQLKSAIWDVVTQAQKDKSVANKLGGVGGWLYSNVIFIGQTACAMGLLQVATGVVGPLGDYFKRFEGLVSGQLGKVFHDDDIIWFIESHAHLRKLFNQLENQAALLQGYPVEHSIDLFSDHIDLTGSSFDIEYLTQALETTWTMLIQDIEQVSAFISYKKDVAEAQMPLVAIRFGAIQQKIAQITDGAAGQVEHELNQDKLDQLLLSIKKFRQSLELELQSFSDFESFLG